MGIKEFAWKTTLFIILPALIIYGKSCEKERVAHDQAACRTCMQALRDTTLTAITLIGATQAAYPNYGIVQKRLTAPYVLRKLPGVVAGLRPERVDIAEYRSTPGYRIILTCGPLACDMSLYKARAGREVLVSASDSVYIDSTHRFYTFTDSVFQHTPAGQPL
jgi:hypothetical protein